MLDVAIRRPDGEVRIDLGRRDTPPLPVDPALASLLPHGLRRGSMVAVTGSISMLLALLGAASADGAWCALVGFPHVSAEAADGYGLDLTRLAIVPAPGASWATAVGALVDAVDIVAVRIAARPQAGPAPGEVRRLAARARSRDAVLMPFGGDWPGAELRLTAAPGAWAGIGEGYGRLRTRQVTVTATGRGQAARPRSAELWLPTATGGLAPTAPAAALAPVIPLTGNAG